MDLIQKCRDFLYLIDDHPFPLRNPLQLAGQETGFTA
jgi:hypothetical protein